MDVKTNMSVFNEELFMTRLEEQCLHPSLSSGTASEKADLIRNVLVHQVHARAQGMISDTALGKVQDQYWDMYSKVVDNFDAKEGLNNFAEGALALCNLHRNESQAWKSSLNLKSFLSSSTGVRFRKSCQVSVDAESCETPEQVVNIRTDVKLPETRVSSADHRHTQGQTGIISRGQVVSKQTTDINSNSQTFTPIGQNPFYKQIPNNNPQVPGNEPPALNTLPGKQQNNFSFKNGLSHTEKNSLPYDVPPGWDHPPLAEPSSHRQPTYSPEPNYNLERHHGDQEVPRKPLFASSEGPIRAMRGRSYGNPNPAHPAPNFYRRAEVGRENPNPIRPGAEEGEEDSSVGPFRTAKEQLSINQQKKYGQSRGPVKPASYGSVKKSLGTRRGPGSRFVPPVVGREETGGSNLILRKAGPNKASPGGEEPFDEKLKGLEPKMIELIMNEIMDHGAPVAWDDIAGLDFAKKTIKEIVVWPMLRPDIFTGLRGPPKGLLLFGPPGTGKTLIGKCIASQSKSTFFSISASSLTSKWVGEGEKMVKALFSVSRCHQPAVIFIDEIDSLLSQRTDGEHEASRRIKTEFLVQLDGATTDSDERLLVIGATNRPQEIDEAARRRFVKRLYIPLPEKPARQQIILNLLSSQRYQLSEQELDVICERTEGYSGSDMANLCREAALGPIRSISFTEIEKITADQVRPINFEDFVEAISQVRASVSTKDLDLYIDWNKLYGCGGK